MACVYVVASKTYCSIREELLISVIALGVCDGRTNDILQRILQIGCVARLQYHNAALAARG